MCSPSDNVNPMLVFETKSGDLTVTRKKEGYIMDFPLNPPTQQVQNKSRNTVGQMKKCQKHTFKFFLEVWLSFKNLTLLFCAI